LEEEESAGFAGFLRVLVGGTSWGPAGGGQDGGCYTAATGEESLS